VIEGFRAAYGITDVSDDKFQEVDLKINWGRVSRCYQGIMSALVSNTWGGSRGVHFRGVSFREMGRWAIRYEEYMVGCSAHGCDDRGPRLQLTSGQSLAFYSCGNNCPGQDIQSNDVNDLGTGGSGTSFIVSIGSITDTTTYPQATWESKTIVRNHFHNGADTPFNVSSTPYTQLSGTAN